MKARSRAKSGSRSHPRSGLRRRVALVSGASSGIGEASAFALAEQGYALALGARGAERLDAMQARLHKRHPHAVVWCSFLDVTRLESVRAFVAQAQTHFGAIDVLINNAGLARGADPIEQSNPSDWDEMIDTNLKGALYLLHACLPHLLKRRAAVPLAHVVNIGSTAAHAVYEGGGVYCATKHALRAVTQTLRMEMLGKPIRITEIDPGMVETQFSEVRFRGDRARAKAVYQGMRPLEPADIAQAIVFALSQPERASVDQLLLTSADQAMFKIHRR